jgi:Amt family ammonium transporter
LQFVGAAAVLVYSLVVTLVIALVIKAVIGLRVTEEQEVSGVDLAEHAESAYELGESGGGGVFAGVGHAGRARAEEQ